MKLIIILLAIFLIISACADTENTGIRDSNCNTYNDENLQKIKFDFWDTKTNTEIEKCLQTSENIRFYNITNDDFIQKYPTVSGDYVVWEDYRNGKTDVYLYDIPKEEESQITVFDGEDFKPFIRKNLILFHKQYEGDLINHIPKLSNEKGYWSSELFMYDIINNKFIQLSNVNLALGIIAKGSFDGDYIITDNGVYDTTDRINRDPNRIVTVKCFGAEDMEPRVAGPSFPTIENDSVKTLVCAKESPLLKTPIKFVPSEIQKLRKRNWEPPKELKTSALMIIDDPTPPNLKRICTPDTCEDILKRDPTIIDCLHSERLCQDDEYLYGGLPNPRGYLQSGLLIGGNIFNISSGDYQRVNVPYKQVKGSFAIDYSLRWRLEDLALLDLKKKPVFYNPSVPNEVLSGFDPTMDLFSVCLKKHHDQTEDVCDKWRNYVRIYDFSNNKYSTIKGNLWGSNDERTIIVERGDFDIDKYIGNVGIMVDGINLQNHPELDFNDNRIVWTVNNEKIINEVSNQNTDIKLAVIT
ncbi:MAG TPA: hypothetical protein VJB08_01330 [Candidatus Nanoarchaeia archaeon]|nr:hypothetical protein [Candidatus Nanoarchaeia archaeon]